MNILLDSSVWISYFHTPDVHHSEAVEIVSKVLRDDNIIFIPEIIYVEVLNNIWRLTKDKQVVERCKTVFHHSTPFVELVFGDRNFWFSYVEEIMEKISLRSSDLIIAAHIKHNSIDRFESFDKELKMQVEKL